jgi:hypothetical protein
VECWAHNSSAIYDVPQFQNYATVFDLRRAAERKSNESKKAHLNSEVHRTPCVQMSALVMFLLVSM